MYIEKCVCYSKQWYPHEVFVGIFYELMLAQFKLQAPKSSVFYWLTVTAKPAWESVWLINKLS